jgi:transcriptional regulator with XRE-family HTH domain
MIHERLKKRRQEKGLKQAELARIVGVGRDSYNKYERSGVNPSLEVLARIATALDTTTDYLLGNTDDPTPLSQNFYGESEAHTASNYIRQSGISSENSVSEPRQNYQSDPQRAVIQLDNAELSLIIDYREIDYESKSDLCRMAKTLAENARLKKMLKTDE